MTETIAGHFDGKYIAPDGPVKLPIGKPLRIRVELAPPINGKKKRPGKRIKITGTGQFDSEIPDLGANKKHLEGLGKK